MDIFFMSKDDFKNVPRLEETDFVPSKETFGSIVIIPTDEEHDSGFLCMDFVLVGGGMEPICRISGGSDVVCLDGFGGYGIEYITDCNCKKDEEGNIVVEPKSWKMDCLPCGYLRLFAKRDLRLSKHYEFAGSAFEIFAT